VESTRGALPTGDSSGRRQIKMQNLPIESKKLLSYTISQEFVVNTNEQAILPPIEIQGHDAV
jgi:hypothetical protein